MYIPGCTQIDVAPVKIVTNIGDYSQSKGIQLLADPANSAIVFIGYYNVESSIIEGRTGFPISPGSSVFIPTDKVHELYAISTLSGQLLWYFVV